jgi:hypothetical protein
MNVVMTIKKADKIAMQISQLIHILIVLFFLFIGTR